MATNTNHSFGVGAGVAARATPATTKTKATSTKRPVTSPSGAGRGMRAGASEQFVHEACYARTAGNRRPTKGGGVTGPQKPTGADIVGEILRDRPEHYRHLEAQGIKPQPPRHLAGVHPKELKAWYRDLCAKAKEMKEDLTLPDGRVIQRRQRSSTTILGAAVASYPGPSDDSDERYVAWREAVVAWAQEEYADRLAGVYEHVDEPHGHIHIVFSMNGENVKLAMKGYQFVDVARRQGLAGGELTQAYRDGCKAYQDFFHKRVGQPLGLNRKGPAPIPRVSWQVAKARARAREAFEAEYEQQRLALRAERARLELLRSEVEEDRRQVELAREQQREWLLEQVAEGYLDPDRAEDMARSLGVGLERKRGPRPGA